MSATGLSFHAYDFLTGHYLTDVPIKGVQFGRLLDGVGSLTGTVNLDDPRVQRTNVIGATVPDRSVIVADWKNIPVWHGVSKPRKWDVDSSSSGTTGVLSLSYSSIWSYFQQRVQATDYSSPPYSGIATFPSTMPLWTQTPWFAPLIAAQVVEDALTVAFGNPLGGMTVTLNGEVPNPQFGHEVSEADYVAVNYPYPSLQNVESIVTSLAQLGLGVGFDHAVAVVYRESGSPLGGLTGRFEIDWPWRGAPGDPASLDPRWELDLARARKYSFPEDGSQTGNTVYEVGGGGAIWVEQNVAPLEQGYPLLERVVSRSSIQSPKIMSLLQLNAHSDLALYSYAPTTPTVTIGIEDSMVQLGLFEVGDLMRLKLAKGIDPRFPEGLDQTWRLTAYNVDARDEGDATVLLTFARPPLYLSEVITPGLP